MRRVEKCQSKEACRRKKKERAKFALSQSKYLKTVESNLFRLEFIYTMIHKYSPRFHSQGKMFCFRIFDYSCWWEELRKVGLFHAIEIHKIFLKLRTMFNIFYSNFLAIIDEAFQKKLMLSTTQKMFQRLKGSAADGWILKAIEMLYRKMAKRNVC